MPLKQPMLFQISTIALGTMCSIFQLSCSNDNNNEQEDTIVAPSGDEDPQAPNRPEGWTEESHGPDVMPNYEMAFAQDQVKRIDLEIAPEDWQAMLDNMTELYGEFGSGSAFGDAFRSTGEDSPSDPPFEIPPAAIEACNEKQTNAPCSIQIPGTEPIVGHCVSMPVAKGMVCVPNDIEKVIADRGIDAGTNTRGFPSENPVWVPCTFRFEGKVWHHVGIRFKGQSTLMTTWGDGNYKLPFKLDFDQFETEYPEVLDQRFYGVKRFSATNNMFDDSYLREKVVCDLFREGGVPTPRSAFFRVYVDTGESARYFGLYAVTEVPERAMFSTQFGATGGNLYKPRLGFATWAKDTIVDESAFSKKTNKEAADFSDMQNAIAALHAPREDAATWRKNLETFFDADGFMRWLAINTVIQNWDSYGNTSQNHYLYGDPTVGGRLSWIPWDHNLAFSSVAQLGMAPLPLDMSTVGESWPLIRYLFDDPVYNQAYWKYVEEFINGSFALDVVIPRVQREHALIKDHVLGPNGELPEYSVYTSAEAFLASIDELISHVHQRHQAVYEALQTKSNHLNL